MQTLVMIAFFSLSVFAESTCQLYEITGRVRFADKKMVLLMAEKSLSQRSFVVDGEIQNQLAPYLDHLVKGTFLLGHDKILKARDLKDGVFDPLNAGQETALKFLGGEVCPQ
jgi:hypothetical protein